MNPEDLFEGSTIKVSVECDCCHKIIQRSYCDYIKCHDNELGDTCVKCSKLKRKQSNMKKYGVEWFTQTDTFQDKRKYTMLEKYGAAHSLQSEVIKEKFKNTCRKNNGVDYPMLSKKIKDKRKQTYLDRYGVDCPLKSEVVRKKIENTCLEKYGVSTTALVPEIRQKQRESLYQNGAIASSNPERKTVQIIAELFGEENCYPQFPTKFYNLDCLLTIGDTKIDIEYDGLWCHKESFDNKRDSYHMNHGYKILRIKGNSKIPTKGQIISAIDYLLQDSNNYTEIVLEHI